jgi:hypothetical protein
MKDKEKKSYWVLFEKRFVSGHRFSDASKSSGMSGFSR